MPRMTYFGGRSCSDSPICGLTFLLRGALCVNNKDQITGHAGNGHDEMTPAGQATFQLTRRCDFCRGRLGLIIHRYYRMRFCCEAHMRAYRQRLTDDTRAKIRRLAEIEGTFTRVMMNHCAYCSGKFGLVRYRRGLKGFCSKACVDRHIAQLRAEFRSASTQPLSAALQSIELKMSINGEIRDQW